jgi:chorismate dehydratase
MRLVRIGAVSYLNTRPLVYGLKQHPGVALSFDLPSVLAEKLRAGDIDVGLVPIVEYLRGVGDAIIPGICIASDGDVRTVKLFSRVHPAQLGSVGVDTASRTSVALLRILLGERFGVTPDFHSLTADLRRMLQAHEGALLIGDAAFTDSGAPFVWDLGQGWKELTGQPFVYAAWVVRAGVDVEQVGAWLHASLAAGMQHIDDIVHEAPPIPGAVPAAVHEYLTRTLHFSLGARELRGIATFQKHCLRYNLVPAARELVLAAPIAEPATD